MEGLGLGLFGNESKRIRHAFEEQIDGWLTVGVDLLVFETSMYFKNRATTRLAR